MTNINIRYGIYISLIYFKNIKLRAHDDEDDEEKE